MKGGGRKGAETCRSKEQLSLRGIWKLSGTRMRQSWRCSKERRGLSPCVCLSVSPPASLSRLLLSDCLSLCSVGKITAPAWNDLLVPLLTIGLHSLGPFAQGFERERIHLVTDQPMYWLSLFIPYWPTNLPISVM